MNFNRFFLIGIFFGIFAVLSAGVVFSTEAGEPATIEYTPGESGSFSFVEGFFTLFGNVFGAEDSEYGAEGAKLFVDSETGENFLNVFGEESVVKLGDVLYENMESDSFFQFDSKGDLIGFRLFASEEGTSWNFGEEFGLFEGLSKGDSLALIDGEIIFRKAEEGNGVFNWNGESFKLLGDYFKMSINDEGNYFFNGNLRTELYDISGMGEEDGKFILDRNNRIVEVWKGTKASLYGVDLETSGNNVKISYKEDFDASKYKGTNYFNLGDNKINAGGSGWGFRLEDGENKVFGDMKIEKEYYGDKSKKRFLDISLYGGNIELEKKTITKDYYFVSAPDIWTIKNDRENYETFKDVSFNLKGEGDFIINNGRINIQSYKPKDTWGLYFDSNNDEYSYSYDMNVDFDGKEYILKDNMVTSPDFEGKVLFDANLPWEKVVMNNKLLSSNQDLSSQIESKTGVRPREHEYFLRSKEYETFLKWCYQGTEEANENNLDGARASWVEVCNAAMHEGLTAPNLITTYLQDSDYSPDNQKLGMDNALFDDIMEELYGKNYVSEDIEIIERSCKDRSNERYAICEGFFKNLKETIYFFTGEYMHKRERALDLYGESWGQDALNSLDDCQKARLAYAYYNGYGAKSLEGDREWNYKEKLKNPEANIFGWFDSKANPPTEDEIRGGMDVTNNLVKANVARVVGTLEYLMKLGSYPEDLNC
jgi:hypothetical protein